MPQKLMTFEIQNHSIKFIIIIMVIIIAWLANLGWIVRCENIGTLLTSRNEGKRIAALPQPTIYAMTDNMHLPQLYTQCKIFLSHTTMLRHISAPILTLITIIIMVITTVIIITNTIPICTIFW